MDAYLKELDEKLKAARERFREALRGIRSNRPSVEFIENLKADYYGNPTPLKAIGTITFAQPRDILVTVWDKNAIPPAIKAIADAGAGFTVTNEGSVIRASLSSLSAERREELGRLSRKSAEAARIDIRNIRDEIMKKIRAAEEEKEITEDQAFAGKEKMQKRVNEANAEVEKMLADKIKELGD